MKVVLCVSPDLDLAYNAPPSLAVLFERIISYTFPPEHNQYIAPPLFAEEFVIFESENSTPTALT